jgi:hypothetical protein
MSVDVGFSNVLVDLGILSEKRLLQSTLENSGRKSCEGRKEVSLP